MPATARTPRTPPPVVTPRAVTMGSGGPNLNFNPGFALPGGFFLWGYTRDIDKPAGTARYSTVRVKVHPPITASKHDAVKTALEGALPGTHARLLRSGFGGVDGYARIDIRFGRALANLTAGAAATAANVTAVLAAGAAAIP